MTSSRLFISCQSGLESVVKSELMRMDATIVKVMDYAVIIEGGASAMIRTNLRLRSANKVYRILAEGPTTTFDELFDLVQNINWKAILPDDHPILVDAISRKSPLTSIPTIQKITKKAIVTGKTGKRDTIMTEDERLPPFSVSAFILGETTYILLDTTGPALHKRWYRAQSGEAPMKESLAAGLVMLAGWNYKTPFIDPCTGSGTLAIEAAMIARNQAPGLMRNFDFERFHDFDPALLEAEKTAAREKEFKKSFTIIASDNDPIILEVARRNAELAWVADTIRFEQKAVGDYLNETLTGTLIANPPYGERLDPESVRIIHEEIARLFAKNPTLNGGVITAFQEFDNMARGNAWKKRKLMSGGLPCEYFLHKGA